MLLLQNDECMKINQILLIDIDTNDRFLKGGKAKYQEDVNLAHTITTTKNEEEEKQASSLKVSSFFLMSYTFVGKKRSSLNQEFYQYRFVFFKDLKKAAAWATICGGTGYFWNPIAAAIFGAVIIPFIAGDAVNVQQNCRNIYAEIIKNEKWSDCYRDWRFDLKFYQFWSKKETI